MDKRFYQSPIGMLEIIGDDEGVISILFTEDEKSPLEPDFSSPVPVKECYDQLDEYFQGKRSTFTFTIKFKGTPFQESVWRALTEIPFGETWSYKELAQFIGNEKAIRAVGTTNGKNLLSIVVPCHRVIGSNGKLTGYSGGLWRKKWLLEHEAK
ncbi:methylated-DNA--[protein]-cysteine S-methyltransferase [Falsibacillus albus]|uniref:Methylated-DNA--protein-cysteine methyltransferase n=1 Tax=Falsibacillus albus TaxID=2478915 RepID=A0A3L7JVG3_9BACI|nr:methylated-DNA--[protein]-cysteine S-methyltransferase [Falsibacillus albus]RLQ94295.1 methylated-DNA--[protein]-cysteine S-methyltransferase [Falsibacillus albus]